MDNDQVYAGGLLNRALDPATQPPAIRDFLRTETEYVRDWLPRHGRVIDFGCGTGRHLIQFQDIIGLGVGIDYEQSYIVEATRRNSTQSLHYLVADAAQVPLDLAFDRAVCLTSTWGTMGDKLGVVAEMKRLAPNAGSRLITVYAPTSIGPRAEWYTRLGHAPTEITGEYIAARGGFTSEHFSQERLERLLGEFTLNPIGEVAYLIEF